MDQPQIEGEHEREPESMKEIQSVKVGKVNIVKDVLEIFSKPKVLKEVLRIEFTN